jgi:ankyrin repeat protein
LHLAAAKGNEELVILLLSVEADVNLADKKGLTALHLAAQAGSASVIRSLADASADIDAVDRTDSTALHVAADHGQLSCVEALVKAGCNIDRVDMHGATALIRCIKQAPLNSAHGLHIAVLHALLKAGAVVDASYMRGTTALHIAAQKGHKEIIEALIKYGADRRVKDENGETPADLAKRNKLLTLLTLLT